MSGAIIPTLDDLIAASLANKRGIEWFAGALYKHIVGNPEAEETLSDAAEAALDASLLAPVFHAAQGQPGADAPWLVQTLTEQLLAECGVAGIVEHYRRLCADRPGAQAAYQAAIRDLGNYVLASLDVVVDRMLDDEGPEP